MSTFVELTNKLLRRLNEVPLDVAGDGFDTTRSVQATAKDAINYSIRLLIDEAQEWPFLHTEYTQTISSGTREYSFPSGYSSTDWDTFFLEGTNATELPMVSYERYTKTDRADDSNGTNTGVPTSVVQTLKDTYIVTPVPDATYSISYTYWSAGADLALYNDVCVVPSRWDYIIIEGAMMFMMQFRSNAQMAAERREDFSKGIDIMRRVLLPDVHSVTTTSGSF